MIDVACDTNEFIQKVDVSCDTQDIIKMVDSTCDTHDLMVDRKETQDIDDDSLTSHEMESYNGPMKESLVKEESKEVAHNENNKKFEDTKEESQDSQNDISKMFVRP
jgi:hypothetical protein